MPETTTEPTVGEELTAVVDHDRHLVKHDDCWRCQAHARHTSGDEAEEGEAARN